MQEFNTALLLAAKNASVTTVGVLVGRGAQIEAKNTTAMGLRFWFMTTARP